MNKFRRSWMLFKCALQVIGTNKRLLLFPLLFLVFSGVVLMFFALPIVCWNTGHPMSTSEHWQVMAHRWVDWQGHANKPHIVLNPAGYVLAAVIYLISIFLATFFQVAFYSQILRALAGQPVSIAAGLRTAWSRIVAIAVWSLLTGVVGLLIRQLEERVGLVGRWIVGLLGVAWSVASVFVVPAIILEPKTTNPLIYLKTSASTLKRTWGESLIGYVGVQFGSVLVLLASIPLIFIGLGLSIAFNTLWFVVVFTVLWFVGILAFIYLSSVASQVYRAALYVYASEGSAPAPFNEEQMNMAWKQKK